MALNQSRFKSRKVLRKEARKAKKQRRHDYYARRGKRKVDLNESPNGINSKSLADATTRKSDKSNAAKFRNLQEEQDHALRKEKKQRQILDDEIKRKRVDRLLEDNLEEEKEIKKLEKQLKFRKGKRSGAFALDGLDYLLDICDRKISKNEGERTFDESDDEFDNDLATIRGSKKGKSGEKDVVRGKMKSGRSDENVSDDEFLDGATDQSAISDSEGESPDECLKNNKKENGSKKVKKTYEKESVRQKEKKLKGKSGEKHVKFVGVPDEDDEDEDEDHSDAYDMDGGYFDVEDVEDSKDADGDVFESDSFQDSDVEMEIEEMPKKKLKKSKESETKVKGMCSLKKEKKPVETCDKTKKKKKKNKKKKGVLDNLQAEVDELTHEKDEVDALDDLDEDDVINENRENNNEVKKGVKGSDVWEDIYGRTRDREGNVIKAYKPPHLRNVLSSEGDNMKQEKLLRLKRQLKGLLNRLAENNMASISSQVEELYMSNSRNEMNETLRNLFAEAIITEVLTPERLIAEHAMLIAILHANVGSEIGAYFLQYAVTQFDKMLREGDIPVEDKRINNVLLFIMHLYNFQIFHSKLLYDLIHELLKDLQEKEIELLLLILRTVGFSLRKDDPTALKTVVLKIQEKANSSKSSDENYTRMKFMVETVLAIKNNNVSKIPNYNPELVEHLKKSMKVLIRKGNYKTELNICLQDLLKAEEHGRWWVVGSAWSGSAPNESSAKAAEAKESQGVGKVSFSQKLLDLARRQRMNTDVRRTIFCTLMSAEDYLDAFEKLMKLGLKGAVEREIVNVLLHCALQEKDFNPYYFHLANKFCLFDRRFQIMIQYATWDKIKELHNMLPVQITNLAKFLGNLILSKGLPISVLKVVQFSELDKVAVKFIRQVLLTILLTDEETVLTVFARIVHSPKLKVFRDGLRLFLHHFLLKNVKANPDENSNDLIKMIEVADRALTSSDLTLVF